jgi:5-methylcytosine-specific restriction enzyme subunit McrC
VEVGVDSAPDLPNLLARLLVSGANRLLRRGLDRGYCSFVENTQSPRGRLLLDSMVKEQTMLKGSAVCTYDELTTDVLHNRIIKSTASVLARAKNIAPEYAHDLRALTRRMAAVNDVHLTARLFRRVQLSRNTGGYLPLLKLCEFVFGALLPDPEGSESRFAEILENETVMSKVFEDFLRNFYTHEQRVFSPRPRTMHWDAVPLKSGSARFLPVMETDITLGSPQRIIVIDAKFYKEALVAWQGAKKVRSGHLYQLFAYLEHAGMRHPGIPVDGALIYPAVGEPIDLHYRIRGHEMLVRAIDLVRPWQEIHNELLALPYEFGLAPPGLLLPQAGPTLESGWRAQTF